MVFGPMIPVLALARLLVGAWAGAETCQTAASKSMGLFVGYTLPFLVYLLPLPFTIIDSLTVLQLALIVAAALLTKGQSNTDL